MTEYIASSFAREASTGALLNLVLPGETRPGDLLLLAVVSGGASTTHSVAGWDSVAVRARTGVSTSLWSRVAQAGDADSVTEIVLSTAQPRGAGVIVLRPGTGVISVAATDQGSGSNDITLPEYTPSAETIPLHVLLLNSSTNQAADLTPPEGMSLIASALPEATTNRTGIAFGANFTPGENVGNVWTNTGTHFGAFYTVAVEYAEPAPEPDPPTHIYYGEKPVKAVYLGQNKVTWKRPVPDYGHDLYDEMGRYAKGSIPTRALTGQQWGFSPPGYIQDGGFDAEEGTGAVYLEANVGKPEIVKVGAEWRFDTLSGTRTGTGGTMALITWADGGIAANGFGRRTRCHLTITPGGCSMFVREVEGGGSVTNIGNRGISPALPLDELLTAEVSIEGTTATLTIGERQWTWTDDRLAPRDGEVWACWEPYYTADGTDARVRVTRVWADGI